MGTAEGAQELKSALETLEGKLKDAVDSSKNKEELEEVRHQYLGKKGDLTNILKGLGKVSPEERKEIGQIANKIKESSQDLFDAKEKQLEEAWYASLATEEWIDTTIPPNEFPDGVYLGKTSGHLHPVTLVQRRLEEIFTSMGFSIMDGPEVETDFNNFEALNFTADHPAREMQDTFYTTEGNLLRTHTSPVQVRSMKELKPPMRLVVPGRVFRYEELDASHEHTFNQMEGMVIDREVSVSHLLHLMQTLLREIFEREVVVRLRPGYFPFVEPAFELDMQCLICNGDGCPVCKRSGWVEVLPCGLVHPNVLRSGGLDPEQYQGAAFGLGLTRLAMLKYGIEDIRLLQHAKPEFIQQFWR